MGETTGISWTDATFNPWMGCAKVSPACRNCYAEAIVTGRMGLPVWGNEAPRQRTSRSYWQQPFNWNRNAEKEGRRRRVFCGSLCDVMEDRRDLDGIREDLYRLIQRTPWLDWLLLTKRPQNFIRLLPDEWQNNPPANVWGLTTVESEEYLWRIEALKAFPFAIHGLSIEPLLEDLPGLRDHLQSIKWVIVGGESGRGARPMQPDWVRRIRDCCAELGIPFHFKQWGEHNADLMRVGKKAAGHLLDGEEWRNVPRVEGMGLDELPAA